MHGLFELHTHASSDDHGQFCYARAKEAPELVAVVATLSRGYDLDYIWRQVDRGPAEDAASYYIQASESGGEPPGRARTPSASSPASGSSASRTTYCSASARPPTALRSAGARITGGDGQVLDQLSPGEFVYVARLALAANW
jgi:hypothetical protein